MFLQRLLPPRAFRAALVAGTFIGLLVMARQRHYSREYWIALTGKAPTLRQQLRHFLAFMDSLLLKLGATRTTLPKFAFAHGTHRDAFERLCRSSQPALFGTFHVGYSDMMGCLLSSFNRRVSLVRLRVGNSLDTDILESIFAGMVRFIWINQPEEFLFSLKQAVENGESIGLQCDRVEFGARLAPFSFLGMKRMFPTTIYHLSALFQIPVVFAYPGPRTATGTIEAHTSKVFVPEPDRRRTLESGMLHFQEVLNNLERHLRANPELWFNFIPLNPPVHEDA